MKKMGDEKKRERWERYMWFGRITCECSFMLSLRWASTRFVDNRKVGIVPNTSWMEPEEEVESADVLLKIINELVPGYL